MALNLIEIKDFPKTTTLVGSGEELIVVSKADGKTYGIKTSDFKAFLGTVQSIAPRPISPTDPAPTLDGVYIPTANGTYTNAGGLTVNTAVGGEDYGMATQFIKNGSVWVKSGYPLPMQDLSELEHRSDRLEEAVFGSLRDVTPSSWVNGFVTPTGAFNAHEIYRTSNFIPVIEGDSFEANLSGTISTLIVSSYSSSSQSSFILGSASNIQGSSTPLGSESIMVSFTIPSGVNFIRVGYQSLTPGIYLKKRLSDEDNKGLVEDVYGLDIEVAWEDGFVAADGTANNTSSGYKRSGFYPVEPGQYFAAGLSGSVSTLSVSAYSDDNQNSFIADSDTNILGSSLTGAELTDLLFKISEGVNFIRLTRSSPTPIESIYFREAGILDKISYNENSEHSGSLGIAEFSILKRRVVTRRRPVFSFIFDDLNPSDDLVHDVFKDFGMQSGFAIQTNKLNAGNIPLYQGLYMEGSTILSHGTSSINTEVSMRDSKIILESNHFKTSGWVTNSSVLDPSMLPTVKKYYGYAFTKAPMNKGVMPTPSDFNETVDPCELRRIGLETWNKDETNQSALKGLIDFSISNNLLIVFYGHKLPSSHLNTDGVTSSFTEADLRGLLTYLKDKQNNGLCDVLTPDEAVYQYYKGWDF